MKKDPGHGVFDLLEALKQLDGMTVRFGAQSGPGFTASTTGGSGSSGPSNNAEFDRMVRESLDRQHRRKVIAEG
jgi:hypothetical protein